jgi:hypothetical protein
MTPTLDHVLVESIDEVYVPLVSRTERDQSLDRFVSPSTTAEPDK